jgi:hypothetical protein
MDAVGRLDLGHFPKYSEWSGGRADNKARANFEAFDRIIRRRGGKAPQEGDEMPARVK